ncbi:MAG: hypothetical protein AAF628_10635 [Planctomycetota bacterium]
MMKPHSDHAARALRTLRDSVTPPAYDPALEGRLTLAHRRGRRQAQRLVRVVATAVGLALLAGGVGAATGGLDWIARWWAQIWIDGVPHQVDVRAGEPRELRFQTADGRETVVRVEVLEQDGRVHTRLESERTGPTDHDVDTMMSSAAAEDQPRPARLDETAGREPIHLWTEPTGEQCAIFAVGDGRGGTRVLLRSDVAGRNPRVELMGTSPLDLLANGARITVRFAVGQVAVRFARLGHVHEFVWRRQPTAASPPTLRTPDGAVEIRLDRAPRRDAR